VQLILDLSVADLAATRFAISPLAETLRAVQLLGRPDTPAVNRPWVRWARAELELRPLRLPRLWPLVVPGRLYVPEFLFPAPPVRSPAISAELAQVCATPAGAVRASVRRVFGDGPWPDSARELERRPRESLAQIAAEIAECHDRLIVPHWERLRSVLEADIAYHAGLLAGGGARSLFRDLHPDFRWSDGRLWLRDTESGTADDRVTVAPDGLILTPGVFNWPEWSVKRATSTQTDLWYPARGAATVWEDGVARAAAPGTADLEPVEALLGAPRVRLLVALRSPATTTALARRLSVTPSAVSQHLAVLRRGGLVDRQRSGRMVLYQTSALGLALLGQAGLGQAGLGQAGLGQAGSVPGRAAAS
jgi:DNA-binding transcriptional ArsR family regulator